MTLINLPSELSDGEDLILKKLRIESAATLFHAITTNREHLAPWLPFVDHTWKPEDTEIFIRSVVNDQSSKRDLVFEIWSGNEFAGLIALKELDRWNKKTEIGYWIIKRFEGQGLITRSCRILIDLAFKSLGMNRIQIKAGIGNARSLSIPERLNFRFEGIERNGEKLKRGFIDLATYSLLKEEWEENNN